MPYNVHVVRTSHWRDAAQSPITKEEITALIAADKEMAWSPANSEEITWRGTPSIRWQGGQLVSTDPDKLLTAKLIRMAGALNANLVGENGEHYVLRRNMWGPERIHKVQPSPST